MLWSTAALPVIRHGGSLSNRAVSTARSAEIEVDRGFPKEASRRCSGARFSITTITAMHLILFHISFSHTYHHYHRNASNSLSYILLAYHTSQPRFLSHRTLSTRFSGPKPLASRYSTTPRGTDCFGRFTVPMLEIVARSRSVAAHALTTLTG